MISQKRLNFPYTKRHCPFCERELTLVEAIHIQETPEDYKALFICFNNQCGAYDEDARQAYARVYYSSERAFHMLEGYRIYVDNYPKKK
jgi:hypothetical protein